MAELKSLIQRVNAGLAGVSPCDSMDLDVSKVKLRFICDSLNVFFVSWVSNPLNVKKCNFRFLKKDNGLRKDCSLVSLASTT